MKHYRNLYIPPDWDPSWPEIARYRELYAIEEAEAPNYDAGETFKTLDRDRWERYSDAAREGREIFQTLSDHVMRRKIVAQSKRPICDLVCDVVEKSEDHGDHIPEGAYEAFRGLMHHHYGYGKPTPDPNRNRGRSLIGTPTFAAYTAASLGFLA